MKRLLIAILLCLCLAGPVWAANECEYDANCVALWNFDNGALTTDTASTNTLTNNGVATSTSSYRQGTASADIERGDSFDCLRILDTDLASGFPLKNGETTTTFSVCFWMNMESLPTTGLTFWILDKGYSGTNTKSFGVAVTYDGGAKLQIRQGHTGGTAEETVTHASALTGTPWYHVGVVYDGSTNNVKVRIYDNTAGAQLGTDVDHTFSQAINVENATLYIGLRGDQAWQYDFDGQIDEMVWFDKALTNDEIDSIRAGTYVIEGAADTVFAGVAATGLGDGSDADNLKVFGDANWADAGTKVWLADGDYGSWTPVRSGVDTNDIEFESINLYGAVFTDLNLYRDYYTFKRIRFQPDNPSELPSDDGSYQVGTVDDCVAVSGATGINFYDCDIQGPPYRWLGNDAIFVISGCNDVNVAHCRIHHAPLWGIYLAGSSAAESDQCRNVTIQNCQIYDLAMGGGITVRSFVGGDILIKDTVLFDFYSPYEGEGVAVDEPFCPWNVAYPDPYHNSTGIGIHSYDIYQNYECLWDSFTLDGVMFYQIANTGNNTYSGAEQGCQTYQSWGSYSGLTIQNCQFLSGSVIFRDLKPTEAKPVIIRNNLHNAQNTENQSLWWTSLVERYNNSYSIGLRSGTTLYDYIYHWNNMMLAQPSTTFPGNSSTSFTSNNNLMWTPYYNTIVPDWKGPNDVFCIWGYANSPHGNWNVFTEIGSAILGSYPQTPEYTYSDPNTNEIFTNYSRKNYTLSGESFYLDGFIDPNEMGDVSNQPTTNFGTFDANGFIVTSVYERDADHYSVGPYDGRQSFGNPMRPVIPFPYNQKTDVDEDPTLSWTAGINAATYNVYVGTNKALVAARDASTLQDTGVTDTSYALSSLTGATTYYWAVDSVDASANVGNGVVWEFTTGEPPVSPIPSNPSPADGAVDQRLAITLSWDAVDGADTYDLVVSDDLTWGDVDDIEVTQAGVTYSATRLSIDHTYYWRVRSTISGVDSDWLTSSFTTESMTTNQARKAIFK